MQQVIVRKTDTGSVLHTVPAGQPEPGTGQCLVQVDSISLNRGEIVAALKRAQDGWKPGWDFAGSVVRAAADGTGPAVGSRVAGFKASGAWAEVIAVDTQSMATLPDSIDFEVASTLPVAGLTALYALEKAPSLLGSEVLVTGASGGLGQFATQLALLGGASVTAAVHRNAPQIPAGTSAALFRAVSMDATGLAELRSRRYDVIVESVGGDVFSAAAESVAFGGTLVALGGTRSSIGTFDIRSFFNIGRARIYGFNIFDETIEKPVSAGLRRLFKLIETGRLIAPVTYRGSITDLDRVARELLESKIPGKAVLRWAS